eukprot:5606560-Pyramimonas_sp.AAC.1
MGSSTESPSATVHVRIPPPTSAHRSRVSWPHREPHRRPNAPVPPSTCVPPPLTDPLRHAPHTLRGPIGSNTEDDVRNCVTHNCMWLGPSPLRHANVWEGPI